MEAMNKKIRKIRKIKGITLKELSEKTNLSTSFISQIERGISDMTITSLKKIADALEVSMREFFEEEVDTSFTKKKEKQKSIQIQQSNTKHINLSGIFQGRKLEAILSTYQPYHSATEEISHEGEEFYYVLEGSGIFIIDGKEYILNSGESIHFPSTLPHSIVNDTDKELKTISVLTQLIFQ